MSIIVPHRNDFLPPTSPLENLPTVTRELAFNKTDYRSTGLLLFPLRPRPRASHLLTSPARRLRRALIAICIPTLGLLSLSRARLPAFRVPSKFTLALCFPPPTHEGRAEHTSALIHYY